MCVVIFPDALATFLMNIICHPPLGTLTRNGSKETVREHILGVHVLLEVSTPN